MSIFVIFRVANPATMEARLVQDFPNDHLVIVPGQYLVSAVGTAKDVSDKLGITDGPTGSAIVFRMSSYYGRATSDEWDWIKTKSEQASG